MCSLHLAFRYRSRHANCAFASRDRWKKAALRTFLYLQDAGGQCDEIAAGGLASLPAPERVARQHIDQLLEAAGWHVQDHAQLNLGAASGIAVCEFPIKGAGYADYLLFVARKAVGAIEAKKEVTDRQVASGIVT